MFVTSVLGFPQKQFGRAAPRRMNWPVRSRFRPGFSAIDCAQI
jgi:hypothetical protein